MRIPHLLMAVQEAAAKLHQAKGCQVLELVHKQHILAAVPLQVLPPLPSKPTCALCSSTSPLQPDAPTSTGAKETFPWAHIVLCTCTPPLLHLHTLLCLLCPPRLQGAETACKCATQTRPPHPRAGYVEHKTQRRLLLVHYL